jgi:hypothetical protein
MSSLDAGSEQVRAGTPATLNQTIAMDGGSPVAPATAGGDAEQGSEFRLAQPELLSQLGSARPEPRYSTGQRLGIGASGEVFALEDRNLLRVVAVKVLSRQHDEQEVGHFVHEARIAASLAHPNVPPIYDLDVAADGRVYFTMPRITGRSLGAVIECSAPAARDARISHPATIASIGVAVAQALACAHHRQVIHQDVKPDNIMLGDFGEILLVDWGSAVHLEPGIRPQLYGTPLYMSPEQGRNEGVDQRSDIYCLGATLFHALLLRVPTWSDDSERFWLRKRRGEIDQPTAEERARHPAALLDILGKCLAAEPGQRYQRIEDLLADLHAYQNGLAVTAHRETLPERLGRWHRHHGRSIYLGGGLAALLAIVVLLLYGQRLEEMARWGAPVIANDFTAPLGPEWKLKEGSFAVHDGWLVSTGKLVNVILLDRRLHGSTAIEYDGTMLPGSRACDVSMIWCRDRVLNPDGATVKSLVEPYYLQLGANDNSGTRIWVPSGTLAWSPLRLEDGRRYHIRIEVIDDRLSLTIDGVQQCSWHGPFPFHDGYLCFYGFYPRKAFGHLRVFSRGSPEKVRATGIGDAFVAHGDYQDAAEEYARVVESHPGTALGDDARYREGLCSWRLGQEDQALAIWQPLRGGHLGDRVRLHDLDRDQERGDQAAILAGIESMWPAADAEIRTELALNWARYVNSEIPGKHLARIAAYLDLHDRLMSGEHEIDGVVADALLAVGRNQEILSRFPTLRFNCAQALGAMGRWYEVIRDYPEQDYPVQDAYYETGQFEKLDATLGAYLYIRSLVLSGRYQEAHDFPNVDCGIRGRSLMAMGRLEQALVESQPDPPLHAECLLLLGRADELPATQSVLRELVVGDASKVLAATPAWTIDHMQARWRGGLEGWIAGDRKALDGLPFQPVEPQLIELYVLPCFYQWTMRPFLQQLAGDHDAVARSGTEVLAQYPGHYQQRLAFDAKLLSGAIDAPAYLAQPVQLFTRARLQLLEAMRAELAGDGAGAVTHYRAWLASPEYERGERPDPVLNRLVAWRLAVLGAAAPDGGAQGVPRS